MDSTAPYAELAKNYTISLGQRAYTYLILMDSLPILGAITAILLLSIVLYVFLRINKKSKNKKSIKTNTKYVMVWVYILSVWILSTRQIKNIEQLVTTIVLPELRMYQEYKKISNGDVDTIVKNYIMKDITVKKN